MKKILYLISSLLLTSMLATSCLKGNENATATIYYVGMTDSIKLSDKSDSVWIENIVEALVKMKVTGEVFMESDTTEASIQDYAVLGCNEKAGKNFNNTLKKVNLKEIKKTIFNAHADSLIQLGYSGGAESLPIDKFTLYTSLWSLYNNSLVFWYENTIE